VNGSRYVTNTEMEEKSHPKAANIRYWQKTRHTEVGAFSWSLDSPLFTLTPRSRLEPVALRVSFQLALREWPLVLGLPADTPFKSPLPVLSAESLQLGIGDECRGTGGGRPP